MKVLFSFKSVCLLIMCCVYFTSAIPGFAPTQAQARASEVKRIKPPKSKRLPDLSYRPTVAHENFKYPGRVGVFTMRDKRMMKFYDGEDRYFSESIIPSLSNTLYLELKAGRSFRAIKKINARPGPSITRKEIMALGVEHQIDYVFISDLTAFNLLREKMVKSKRGMDFKINVRFALMGQLVDTQTGAVLWAEPIIREQGRLNSDKIVTEEDYGPSAAAVLQAGFNDMKQSIRLIGLEMRR
jgi:hypothetical protein